MNLNAKIREYENIQENRRSKEAEASDKLQEEMERDLLVACAYNKSLQYMMDSIFKHFPKKRDIAQEEREAEARMHYLDMQKERDREREEDYE